MRGLRSNLDPELLQARWVLGGIEPEQFVEIAVSALEQGFGTTQRLVSRQTGKVPFVQINFGGYGAYQT
jgi:hypothetical protein